MTRYRATLAYDGTAYAGFQRQAGETPTIQGNLETALSRVSGQTATVIGAGRTDAGVHASGQVVAFDVNWRHPPGDLLRALNATLPNDIALQSIALAGADFHPRYSARSRTYVYRLYNRRIRQPLWDRFTWRVEAGLALEAMRQAAGLLVGEHDFATFGQPPQGNNTVRLVTTSTLVEDAQEAGLIWYEITANAFLQRMVRCIVGSLVDVGRGAMTVEGFDAAFRAANRSLAGPSAPPMGLTLVRVDY